MTEFESSGGSVCLDFANTWGNRADPANDRLRSYSDLLRWAESTGIVRDAGLRALRALARDQADEASVVFEEAIELRDTVYRLCATVARGERLAQADLEELNRALAGLPQPRLCCGGACCEWTWGGDEPDLRLPVWGVLRSAADLLTSPDAARIRECEAPDCNWLFLDRSRGRRRRWCDMSSCGNRAKARRYYARHHGNP